PHRTAAGLPGVVLVLPGFGARLTGRRDYVVAPDELAGRGIDGGNEIAHAAIAAGSPKDDLVLDGERRRRESQLLLAVIEIGLPCDFAGFLVGRDHAGRMVRYGNDEPTP